MAPVYENSNNSQFSSSQKLWLMINILSCHNRTSKLAEGCENLVIVLIMMICGRKITTWYTVLYGMVLSMAFFGAAIYCCSMLLLQQCCRIDIMFCRASVDWIALLGAVLHALPGYGNECCDDTVGLCSCSNLVAAMHQWDFFLVVHFCNFVLSYMCLTCPFLVADFHFGDWSQHNVIIPGSALNYDKML